MPQKEEGAEDQIHDYPKNNRASDKAAFSAQQVFCANVRTQIRKAGDTKIWNEDF